MGRPASRSRTSTNTCRPPIVATMAASRSCPWGWAASSYRRPLATLALQLQHHALLHGPAVAGRVLDLPGQRKPELAGARERPLHRGRQLQRDRLPGVCADAEGLRLQLHAPPAGGRDRLGRLASDRSGHREGVRVRDPELDRSPGGDLPDGEVQSDQRAGAKASAPGITPRSTDSQLESTTSLTSTCAVSEPMPQLTCSAAPPRAKIWSLPMAITLLSVRSPLNWSTPGPPVRTSLPKPPSRESSPSPKPPSR